MNQLRSRIIRLAWSRPELRPHLLPLLVDGLRVQGSPKQAGRLLGRVAASTNFCDLDDDTCKDNLGLSRKQMPVIEPDDIQPFIDRLRAGGLDTKSAPKKGSKAYLSSGDGDRDKVKVVRRKIPAGELRATQKVIHADKAERMADRAKTGEYVPWEEPVLVSSDSYILDGHHRWAATLLTDPGQKMSAIQIDLPVDRLLAVANAYTDAIGNTRKAALV